MCGIAGIVGPQSAEHVDAVQQMLQVMRHRGPDAEGVWISRAGNCVLGHCRLAVLDLSRAAAQPMLTPDGRFAFSYNGECYNYRELRQDLQREGERFTSSGDTEVVLRFLARHGHLGLHSLNGMFALAVWDEREQRLLLARDRFGQKPLYWTRANGHLLFASEVRALLASGLVPRRANPNGVLSFLCQGAVQGPETIVAGVSLLSSAGHLLLAPGREPEIGVYWAPPLDKQPLSPAALQDLLVEVVQRHLVSDVPIGLFLSGGIDSSALAAAVSRLRRSRLRSLAVVFPEEPAQSEIDHSRRMASFVGTDHTEIAMSGQEMLGLLPHAMDAMDQPTLDAVNTFIVSAAARQLGLTVALSGLGGDELFGGYPSFRDVPHAMTRAITSPAIRRILRQMLPRTRGYHKGHGKLMDLLDAPSGLVPAYLVRRRVFSTRQMRAMAPQLMGPEWHAGLTADSVRELEALIGTRHPADAVGLLEMSVYLGQMLLRDADVMGMAHSLEIRVPFLDAEFASAVLRLDPEVRIPRRVPKHALVAMVADWLPRENWCRPKQGFTLPFEKWLQCELRTQVADQLAELHRTASVFSGPEIRRLWSGFLARPKSVGWTRPWTLYVLSRYVAKQALTI